VSAKRRWAALGIAALAASWAIAPAVVPVYDGAQFPDEPYRWVSAPAGAKPTKPPTVAKAVIPMRNGFSTAGFANSAEQGPQISLYIPATGLQAPPGTSVITVTATPLAPSQPLPTNGTIITNVYRIAATATRGAVTTVGKTDNTTPTLQMRAPTSKQPGPVFEYRGTQGWQPMSTLSVDGKPVKTLRVGQDIYQTFAPKFGDYALVQLTGSGSGSSNGASGGGSGVSWALLGPGIGILALVGIVSAIRFARTRS
jgi:hypothetical protein